MLGEPSGSRHESSTEQKLETVEDEYVGSPTEFADAEEVPGWMATVAKAIVAIPVAIGTVIGLQLLVVLTMVFCLVLVAIFFMMI